MKRTCVVLMSVLVSGPAALAGEGRVTDVKAVHRNGQTFVTWKDAAEGEAGAAFRYALYRADKPITQANVGGAERVCAGVLNNSARLFGSAFTQTDRLDPAKPTCRLEDGGETLPMWSGLAVRTVKTAGRSYYAVVATDLGVQPVRTVVPGESATTEPVVETVAPIQPVKLYDSKARGRYWQQTHVTGTKGLPLHVSLHASQGRGGGAGAWGDYYLYFATREMGYRDGLPGVFSVEERRGQAGNRLVLNSRDAIVRPDGQRAMETYWFGYFCLPQWATHTTPRAYPFTERRMLWVIDWVIKRYEPDPERVYAAGGSMGAWGSMTFAFRHPEIFAAVYPNRPRTRQRGLPSLVKRTRTDPALMPDGTTDYFKRMDMVRFAAEHHADLPFLGWCCGRRDGFATWQEQIDMVKALTAAHHGFAFAWNNGDHSSGAKPMRRINACCPPLLFARNRSYPAFGNSSIDDNLGSGDPTDGDLEGGVNLGFKWKNVVDEPDRWSVTLTNSLCKTPMTVDVTPRRCQRFKPKPGETVTWADTAGGAGTVTADRWGLVTIERVTINPTAETVLTIRGTQ